MDKTTGSWSQGNANPGQHHKTTRPNRHLLNTLHSKRIFLTAHGTFSRICHMFGQRQASIILNIYY